MRKNFCSAPWSSLAIDPDGSAKICCVSKNRVEFSSINDLKSNPKFVEIRNSFIRDEQHPNCENCWNEESTTQDQWISRRSMFQYDDFYHNLENSTDMQLEYLDARWSNHCNLSCVYCNSTWSSTWAKLIGHRVEQKHRVSNHIKIEKEYLANIKNVLLAGGEPFLMKENIELLETLLVINPNVKIEVTSNLTFNPKNKILQLLEKFNDVTVIASFESTGDRFEYIRQGADWETFKQNLDYCSRKFKLQANMVYFSLSLFNIYDAIQFARSYVDDEEIYIRYEFNGADFHTIAKTNLDTMKLKVSREIEDLPVCLKTQVKNLLEITQSNSVITKMSNLDKFDQLTGKDHKTLFPELYNGENT